VIEIDGVSVRLGGSLVLNSLSARIGPGEMVCVLGPNGAGKSTLLRALAGLVETDGRVLLGGRELAELTAGERARSIAYLPQGQVAHWPISVRETVRIGRLPHGIGRGMPSVSDETAINAALEAVDASHLSGRAITELSGGERARVLLARALAVDAPVLLADEPTAALDPAHQLAVMALLRRLAADGTCVVAALHDLTLAARFATRAIVLAKGEKIADGTPNSVLQPDLLSDVFGISAARFVHEGVEVVVPWQPRADMHR
jgi:iron complex transport system ATP-binding protein